MRVWQTAVRMTVIRLHSKLLQVYAVSIGKQYVGFGLLPDCNSQYFACSLITSLKKIAVLLSKKERKEEK